MLPSVEHGVETTDGDGGGRATPAATVTIEPGATVSLAEGANEITGHG